MSEKKEGLRRVHPDLKRLYQPITEKARSETAMPALHPTERKTVDTWQGFLLSCPSGLSPNTATASTDLIEHDFKDVDEAGSFVCSKQLRRKDLTNSYRKYLIGKKFCYEEAIFHRDNKNIQNVKSRIAYKIGEEENISGGTVLKYNAYSTAIDTIYKNAEELAKYNAYSTAIDTIYKNAEELAFHILMEHLKVSHENTIELSRRASDEIRYISKSVIQQRLKHLTYQDIRHECAWKHTNSKATISRSERREQKDTSSASIRQMPEYDPDADVNSLCMTIGSWVSSIKRVNQNVDFSTITRKATIELVRQLTILEQTINMLQKTLTERDPQ